MNEIACPSRAQLESYVSGALDGGTHSRIDDHVDDCPTCQRAVETLDDLAGSLFTCFRQQSSEAAAPIEPAVVHLAAQAKALGNATNGRASDPTPVVDNIPEGLVLGNYELLESIGAGGMGRVYKAHHRRMKRTVAVKLLAPDLLRSEAALHRFQREVEAVARLAHPNIVAAHDADEAGGRHFLVMEYVEGRNLADVVKNEGPLPLDRALDYVLQAARGLEHAHAAGIVHRDVKPANLLLTAQGTVKVLDMGLARIADTNEGKRDLTSANAVMGTADFMAPEQATNTHAADARADVYSLGCTLCFLLTARPPYDGATNMAVLFAHHENPCPSLRDGCPDCPPALDRVFQRMIAKQPADRYPSMTAAIHDLDRVRQGCGPDTLPRVRSQRGKVRWLVALAGTLAASLVLALTFFGGVRTDPAVTVSTEGVLKTAPAAPVRSPAIAMVTIPVGEFLMGSPVNDPDANADERPQHTVRITQPFLLGKHKITQAQYEEVMGNNPSAFAPSGRYRQKVAGIDTRQNPVESIRWLDAVTFCNRLSERHGLAPYYRIDDTHVSVRGGDGYRLPTEAEWECACRSGTTTRWSFGDDAATLDEHAWHAGNSGGRTHPVGQKKPNKLGLFDMHGTVPEWCWDRYDEVYYKDSPSSDPPGSGKGNTRVYRGGGWNLPVAQTRSATRHTLGPDYGVLTLVGLRVARNMTP